MSTAMTNFMMVEGNRPALRVNSMPTIGARITIAAGLTD